MVLKKFLNIANITHCQYTLDAHIILRIKLINNGLYLEKADTLKCAREKIEITQGASYSRIPNFDACLASADLSNKYERR